MRVNNMRFSPAHRDAPAALDLDVVNEGRGAATGIGYVLQDDALVVSFVETSVLGPGEAEHQRLTWNSVGPGSRHMTLTIGNGAAKWIVHSFDVVSLDEGSRSVAPAAAGAGTGIGAGLGLAAALGLRRVTR